MTTETRAKPESRQATGKHGKKTSTSFKPGRSGNPGGRPKKTEEQRTLENLCREKTPDALETILGIMSAGENERNRLSAAEYVIERGWGKATQPIDQNIEAAVACWRYWQVCPRIASRSASNASWYADFIA